MDLQKLLANTFRERLGIIMDYAHGRMGAGQTTMFARMDHTERDCKNSNYYYYYNGINLFYAYYLLHIVYRIEQNSANLFRKWQRRELDHDEGVDTSSTATLITPLKRPASLI